MRQMGINGIQQSTMNPPPTPSEPVIEQKDIPGTQSIVASIREADGANQSKPERENDVSAV